MFSIPVVAETVAAVHRCTVPKVPPLLSYTVFPFCAAQVALHREDIWAPISASAAAAVEKGKRNGAITAF